MEVQLKLSKSNKCATLPTCKSLLQVPFWFWLIEGTGPKISKVLVLVYMFDAIVSIFLALIFGRALLFHFGHGLLLGWARWARWARRQFGAVGQSCCMRFLEGDLVGILSRSSKIPDFVEVLARRSCGYPSEILCCRGVCEEILRTSCWNPLKDICAKI